MLPTPLYGRSAELLALIAGPLALAPGMRDALRAQIEGARWLVPGMADSLAARLRRERRLARTATPLPRAALLCHDGMGISGPSRAILADADARPASDALHRAPSCEQSRASTWWRSGTRSWIRLPTHPTLAENLALVAILRRDDRHRALVRYGGARTAASRTFPQLDATLATGDHVEL